MMETQVEVCVIGGSFANTPLIRELERSGTSYVVIDKEAPSVWQSLEQEKIDFDLVSSEVSSFYSFGLGERYQGVNFPLGSEFLAFQRQMFELIHDHTKFIEDTVVSIEYSTDQVLCITTGGRRIQSKFVSVGTAFTRAIRSTLLTTDYSAINNQVVLFDGFGDSSKLVMARLLGRGNKFYALSDGFSMLEKLVFWDGKVRDYSCTMSEPFDKVMPIRERALIQTAGNVSRQHSWKQKYFDRRTDPWSPGGYSAGANWRTNGQIVVKPWAVRVYKHLYEDPTQQIGEGRLMDDVFFLMFTGELQLLRRALCSHDPEHMTVTTGKRTIKYDLVIQTDYEKPNLPDILIRRGSKLTKFTYRFKDTFMGVMPRLCPRVFLCGYTRPHFEGLCNIIESQGLLIHELITNPALFEKVRGSIDQRLDAYNHQQWGTSDRVSVHGDHLVMYAEYVRQIAGILEIPRFSGSWKKFPKELWQHLILPDHTIKWRRFGKYAVPNAVPFCEGMMEYHNNYIFEFLYLFRQCLAYKLLLVAGVGTASVNCLGWVSSVFVVGMLLQNWMYVIHRLGHAGLGMSHSVPTDLRPLVMGEMVPLLVGAVLCLMVPSIYPLLVLAATLFYVNRPRVEQGKGMDNTSYSPEVLDWYQTYCKLLVQHMDQSKKHD